VSANNTPSVPPLPANNTRSVPSVPSEHFMAFPKWHQTQLIQILWARTGRSSTALCFAIAYTSEGVGQFSIQVGPFHVWHSQGSVHAENSVASRCINSVYHSSGRQMTPHMGVLYWHRQLNWSLSTGSWTGSAIRKNTALATTAAFSLLYCT